MVACLKMNWGIYSQRGQSVKRTHIDVEKLRVPEVVEEFRECFVRTLETKSVGCDSAEKMWEVITTGLTVAGEKTLKQAGRKVSPDWFEESRVVLEPLLKERDACHAAVLGGAGSERFIEARMALKNGIRKAKEDWFIKKAEAISTSRNPRDTWKDIRALQNNIKGLQKVRTSTLWKKDGSVCVGSEEKMNRWNEHFNNVLNVVSEFSPEILKMQSDQRLRTEMDVEPSDAEVQAALAKLKMGKAAGKNGILPEQLKYAGEPFVKALGQLVRQVWKEGAVPAEWHSGIVVPIPKKGELRDCDNWRGIVLLDVCGKVVARLLQMRLQALAESVLMESQSGFRVGRGCADMIQVVRQLIEKTIEHDTEVYMMFVDLKKAYDSVAREALWKVLELDGVPSHFINLVRSFHDGMQAEVRVDGMLSPPVDVRNGLRQGCTMAPTLFNLYVNKVVEMWHRECERLKIDVGVTVRYRLNGKLVGQRAAKGDFSCRITEAQFADDAALFAKTRYQMVVALEAFIRVAKHWGLTVSVAKTKMMPVSRHVSADDRLPISTPGGEVESVDRFSYLGSMVTSNGSLEPELQERLAKASRAFGALRVPVFKDKRLSVAVRRSVYSATVLSVLLYGSETWAMTVRHMTLLETFHNRCVRDILGVSRMEQYLRRLTTEFMNDRFGMPGGLRECLMERRLRWVGHVVRMPDNRIPRQLLLGYLPEKRPFEGVRMRWRARVSDDLRSVGIVVSNAAWMDLAKDRKKWFDTYTNGLVAWREKNVQTKCEKRAKRDIGKSSREQAGESDDIVEGGVVTGSVDNVRCVRCKRFYRRGGSHQCQKKTKRPTAEERQSFMFVCSNCSRRFKSSHDLTRHRCETTRRRQ